MRTAFIHGETNLFEATRIELVTLFTQEHPDEVSAELAMLLLRDKYAQDGLLAHWSEADVVRFVAKTAPRKALLRNNWAALPEFVHNWLDFLAEQELLTGDPLDALHAAVDTAAPQYLAGMADPSEWGTEKFWRTAMIERGVDENDVDEVAEFATRVENGETGIDDELADRLDADDETEDEALWLPPVQLTADEPHREIAAGAPIIRQVTAAVEWAESNGDPTEADDLVEALGDNATADLVLEWCERTGLLRMSDERIVPTLIAAPILEEPEVLWTRLWQRFVLIEDAFQEQLEDVDEDALPEIVQTLLSVLYAATEPVPIEALVDFAGGALELEDPEALDPVVRTIVTQWIAMDAVHVADEDGQLLEMRPAGQWAARESLRAFGFRVPTVDELRTAPAELIALLFAESPPQTQRVLSERWISHRGAQRAASELAVLLDRVDEPEIRLAALAILEFAGEEGIAAARGLTENEHCGAAVRMWLQAAAGIEIAKPGDEFAVTLDGMAATLKDDLEEFIQDFSGQPAEDQLALINEMAEVNNSSANILLHALAGYHPDEKVGAAAHAALS